MTFDDSRLDAPLDALAERVLRQLASTGARIRRDSADLDEVRRTVGEWGQPRGVLVVGPEARLVRSVLEPICPVPLVAWPFLRLPAWVGPLDLVVALDSDGHCAAQVAEARRRGSAIIMTSTGETESWQAAGSHGTARIQMASEGCPVGRCRGSVGAERPGSWTSCRPRTGCSGCGYGCRVGFASP